jgi:exoribonuclease-2
MTKPPTFDLSASAYAEMIKNGFHPDFPAGSDAQVAAIRAAADTRAESNEPPDGQVRDLRELYWSSIDNDTSRDLDQAEWAERLTTGGLDSGSKDGGIRVRVAIANVAAAVGKGSPIDRHASDQTKTVYTATRNFPMLPNQLSTDLTSLNQNEDRAAVVTEYVVDAHGGLSGHSIYRAVVHNRAQLAYSRVGPWLEGKNPLDLKIAGSVELQAQLRLQDEAAQAMRAHRVADGALEFCRIEADPLVVDGQIKAIHEAPHNRATELIEELMIGANETMAGAVGQDRGAGGAIRNEAAVGGGFGRAELVFADAEEEGPRALSGPLAGRHQADGTGGVCGDRGRRQGAVGTLWSGGTRLHALYGTQPAVCRPGDAKAD